MNSDVVRPLPLPPQLIRDLVAEKPNRLRVTSVEFFFRHRRSGFGWGTEMYKEYYPVPPVYNRPGTYFFRRPGQAFAWSELEDGVAVNHPIEMLEYYHSSEYLRGITEDEITALFDLRSRMGRSYRGKIFNADLLRHLHLARSTIECRAIRRDARLNVIRFRRERTTHG